MVVVFPRCLGCETSVMSNGQVPLLKLPPKPMKNRPARNIGAGFEAGGKDWRSAPKITKRQPIAVPFRRPRLSAIYGAKGKTASPPKPGIAPYIPNFDPT